MGGNQSGQHRPEMKKSNNEEDWKLIQEQVDLIHNNYFEKEFKPKNTMAVLIGVEHYDKVLNKHCKTDRDKRRFENDITVAKSDLKTMRQCCQFLGIEEKDIVEIWEPDHAKLQKHFRDLTKMLKEKAEETLIYVYFTGHGLMTTDTYVCLNDNGTGFGKKLKFAFPLENKLRELSLNEKSFVIGLFDNCRSYTGLESLKEYVPEEGEEKKKSDNPKDDQKGDGEKGPQGKNLVMMYGTQPGSIVLTKTNIAKTFTQYCFNVIVKNELFVFPQDLTQFKMDVKDFEYVAKTTNFIRLWPDSQDVLIDNILDFSPNAYTKLIDHEKKTKEEQEEKEKWQQMTWHQKYQYYKGEEI